MFLCTCADHGSVVDRLYAECTRLSDGPFTHLPHVIPRAEGEAMSVHTFNHFLFYFPIFFNACLNLLIYN